MMVLNFLYNNNQFRKWKYQIEHFEVLTIRQNELKK